MICLSIDVEWASAEVLADLLFQFDQRGLKATFFCTHEGVSVPGHERGIHPNYRPQGDTVRELKVRAGAAFDALLETDIYTYVVDRTMGFAPESTGVRSHSLFYDSQLLPIYQKAGLKYDSSYLLPFVEGLRPVEKEYSIVELPIYYNDFFDLKTGRTGFDLKQIPLDGPGLKVFNFHPNTVFANPANLQHYLDSKPHYQHPDKLLAARRSGKGVRSIFLELLDHLAKVPSALFDSGAGLSRVAPKI